MNKRVIKYIIIIFLAFIVISIGNNDFFTGEEYSDIYEVENNFFTTLSKFIEGIILWIIGFIVGFITNIIRFLFGS